MCVIQFLTGCAQKAFELTSAPHVSEMLAGALHLIYIRISLFFIILFLSFFFLLLFWAHSGFRSTPTGSSGAVTAPRATPNISPAPSAASPPSTVPVDREVVAALAELSMLDCTEPGGARQYLLRVLHLRYIVQSCTHAHMEFIPGP